MKRYYEVHYLVEGDEDAVKRMGKYIFYMATELAENETRAPESVVKVSVVKMDTESA